MAYWVSMTDTFMSGWGKAQGKINKYVVACDTLEQAETIERNAKKRSEMKSISVHSKMPYYTPTRYVVTWKDYNELGEIWTKP